MLLWAWRGDCFISTSKLIFKCLITYFNVLYHGEHFQIKLRRIFKSPSPTKIKPIFYLAKLQVSCYGLTCNSRRAFSLQHVLFTYSLLTEPAPLALFDVDRLLYYKPAPFSILFQYVNFACAIPLNCDAKVIQITLPSKRFAKKSLYFIFS